MGDRASIVVDHGNGELIFLHTSRGGEDLPSALRDGLIKARDGGRAGMAAYLTRILFESLRGEGGYCTTDGFGISTHRLDNDRDYLLVSPLAETVAIHAAACETWNEPFVTWTFDQFCELEDVSWPAILPAERQAPLDIGAWPGKAG